VGLVTSEFGHGFLGDIVVDQRFTGGGRGDLPRQWNIVEGARQAQAWRRLRRADRSDPPRPGITHASRRAAKLLMGHPQTAGHMHPGAWTCSGAWLTVRRRISIGAPAQARGQTDPNACSKKGRSRPGPVVRVLLSPADRIPGRRFRVRTILTRSNRLRGRAIQARGVAHASRAPRYQIPLQQRRTGQIRASRPAAPSAGPGEPRDPGVRSMTDLAPPIPYGPHASHPPPYSD
jgi:hypothetical protein